MVGSISATFYKAIIVPIVGVGACMLSAHFFPVGERKDGISELSSILSPRLGVPHHPQVAEYGPVPADVPRGINRDDGVMNCGFNASVHFLESDHKTADWLRNAIPEEMASSDFEAKLAPYHPPQRLLTEFAAHVRENNILPAQIPDQLRQFMSTFKFTQTERTAFLEFKDTYQSLLQLLPSFRKFLTLYDEAVQDGRPVAKGDSQILRLAISQTGMVNSSCTKQEDAALIVQHILSLQPEDLKVHYEELNEYDVKGLPPIKDHPNNIIPKAMSDWGFSLALPENSNPNLADLFTCHCKGIVDDPANNQVNQMATDGKIYKYRKIRGGIRLSEAPPVLRFQLKRFDSHRPVGTFLSRIPFLSSLFPQIHLGQQKLMTPVQIPPGLDVQIKGKTYHYRLTAAVNHIGDSLKEGHYVAVRIVNNKTYLIDDAKVSLLDSNEAEEAISQAYLVSYNLIQ